MEKIKMKNKDAVEIFNFLTVIRAIANSISLSPKEWLILAKNEEEIEKIVNEVDDKRRELVRKYSDGNTDDEGNAKVSDENNAKFREEFIEIFNDETEIEIEKIPVDSFGDTLQGQVGIIEFMRYMVN